MKTAMISYNAFVSESNGLKVDGNNSVLLLQNADGKTWGTSQFGKTKKGWHEETKAIVDPLWRQLRDQLSSFDKVAIYVGSYGAEQVIELAAKSGLTPKQAVFVLCGCNSDVKMGIIKRLGFSSSRLISCECGGHKTMMHIYYEALNGSF